MAAPFSVEGNVPGTPVWGVDAVGNTVQSGNATITGTITSSQVNAGTQGATTYTGIQTYAAGAGDNTQAEANATVLSTLNIPFNVAQTGVGTQIPDITRDYMCYVAVTGAGGAATMTIGSATGGTTATIFALASITIASVLPSFRLPAGWYIKYGGTATLSQIGIPC